MVSFTFCFCQFPASLASIGREHHQHQMAGHRPFAFTIFTIYWFLSIHYVLEIASVPPTRVYLQCFDKKIVIFFYIVWLLHNIKHATFRCIVPVRDFILLYNAINFSGKLSSFLVKQPPLVLCGSLLTHDQVKPPLTSNVWTEALSLVGINISKPFTNVLVFSSYRCLYNSWLAACFMGTEMEGMGVRKNITPRQKHRIDSGNGITELRSFKAKVSKKAGHKLYTCQAARDW